MQFFSQAVVIIALSTGFWPVGVVTWEMQGSGFGRRLPAGSFSSSGSLPAGSNWVALSSRDSFWYGSGETRNSMKILYERLF